MLRTVLILLAFCAATLAQEAKPQLTFTRMNHDFGSVDKGKEVSVAYEFKNTGQADLEILSVKPSCGCTSAKPEKQTYTPGESGVIPVTFDSSRFSGTVTKSITVTSNDPENPRQVLKLKGNIEVEVSIRPAGMTFANITRDKTMSHKLRVTTDKLQQLEISELTSEPEYLKPEIIRVDDRNVDIQVTLSGADIPQDKKAFTGIVRFKTNGVKQPDQSFRVSVRMLKPIQVSPGLVYFFGSKKGQAREAKVRLRATRADQSLKILGTTSDLEFIKAEVAEEGIVKVLLSENAKEGKFSGVITVKTDLKDQPLVRIPVRGTVI